MKARAVSIVCSLSALAMSAAVATAETRVSHGNSLVGELKYPPNFKHFDYVNPDAPKGGEVRLSTTGSFDSLHPFILKGDVAAGIGLTFETLMTSARDEPSSEYGLLAERAWRPQRTLSWVAYTLRSEARWHDGTPVTPADVIFSFDILKAQGHPQYRTYYKSVAQAEPERPAHGKVHVLRRPQSRIAQHRWPIAGFTEGILRHQRNSRKRRWSRLWVADRTA